MLNIFLFYQNFFFQFFNRININWDLYDQIFFLFLLHLLIFPILSHFLLILFIFLSFFLISLIFLLLFPLRNIQLLPLPQVNEVIRCCRHKIILVVNILNKHIVQIGWNKLPLSRCDYAGDYTKRRMDLVSWWWWWC